VPATSTSLREETFGYVWIKENEKVQILRGLSSNHVFFWWQDTPSALFCGAFGCHSGANVGVLPLIMPSWSHSCAPI